MPRELSNTTIANIIKEACALYGTPSLSDLIDVRWSSRLRRCIAKGGVHVVKGVIRGSITISREVFACVKRKYKKAIILHEVAHVIVGYYHYSSFHEHNGHGLMWHLVAAKIGADPTPQIPPGWLRDATRRQLAYLMICRCGQCLAANGYELSRMKKGAVYHCPYCNRRATPKDFIRWESIDMEITSRLEKGRRSVS